MSEKMEPVTDSVEDDSASATESLALQKERIEEMRRLLRAQGHSKTLRLQSIVRESEELTQQELLRLGEK